MTTEPAVPIPRYGEASLADLMPSLLAALGVAGQPNPLGIEPLERVCLLLVDGLGWEQLRAHAEAAPFLSEAGGRAITAGFPATTVASLGSLGTGLPPGEHGLVGYTFAVGDLDQPMNALTWSLAGIGPDADLETALPPGRFSPGGTLLQRAVVAGVEIVRVGPPDLDRSALSRAVLRGGSYDNAYSLGDLAAEAAAALDVDGRRIVSAYHPGLDTTGHIRGVHSDSWRLELANVDRLAAQVFQRLPTGAALVVTGDHGMVDVPEEGKVDPADHPALIVGVRMLGGEGRARHVYAEAGAGPDVLDAWREIVGDRMWVRSRDGAIEEGWFGPTVAAEVRPRIGDVVAAAFAPMGVFERAVDPMQAMLIGHHGSMTSAEQLVPFVEVRR